MHDIVSYKQHEKPPVMTGNREHQNLPEKRQSARCFVSVDSSRMLSGRRQLQKAPENSLDYPPL